MRSSVDLGRKWPSPNSWDGGGVGEEEDIETTDKLVIYQKHSQFSYI